MKNWLREASVFLFIRDFIFPDAYLS